MRYLARNVKKCWAILKVKIYFWLKGLEFLGQRGIYYIGSSETLPPPLTVEEERELLSQWDSNGFNIRKILIERNLRLVIYIARKFESSGACLDDLISTGSVGLIKAINTFDPQKNIKLATYASRCVENEILMYLRKNNIIRTEMSIDEPINLDCDGHELLLSDTLSAESDNIQQIFDTQVDKDLLQLALTRLSERERRIIELRFGLKTEKELTQKEVADMMGISQSYISRLEKKIIKWLQGEIRGMIDENS